MTGHDDRPVRVEHRDHDSVGAPGLAERREAGEIGEQDADHVVPRRPAGPARRVDESAPRPATGGTAGRGGRGGGPRGRPARARATLVVCSRRRGAGSARTWARRTRRAPRRRRPRRSRRRASGRAGRASRRGTARRTPPSAIRSGGTRSARRAAIATNASEHQHVPFPPAQPPVPAERRRRPSPRPSSTSATPIARSTTPPRRR